MRTRGDAAGVAHTAKNRSGLPMAPSGESTIGLQKADISNPILLWCFCPIPGLSRLKRKFAFGLG